jgi:hypothetical protein
MRPQAIYIFLSNKLDIPLTLSTARGIFQEKVLVDSGAMENFID